MTIDFEADNHIFVNDFGQIVEFTLKSGEKLPLTCILDDAFYDPEMGNMIIEMTDPLLTCVEADIQKVNKNDTVIINGKNYIVFQIQPDGTGMAVIRLEEC